MFGLAYAGARLSFVNLDHHQSVTDCHPNLVLKFAYLKDMGDVDPFNITVVDGEKESE